MSVFGLDFEIKSLDRVWIRKA